MNKYSEYKFHLIEKVKTAFFSLKSKTNKYKSTIEEVMITLLCIYVVTTILDSSVLIAYDTYDIIVKIIRYTIYIICIIFSFVDFFFFQEKIEIPITWFLLALLVIMVTLVSKSSYLIIFTLILFSYRNISFEKIVNRIKTSVEIVFYSLIILTTLKILPDWTYRRDYSTLRHSLGFFYPTMLSTSYLYIMMLEFYVQKRAIKYIDILTYALICSFVYLLSDSRTGYIIALVLVVIMVINKTFNFRIKHKLGKVVLSIFPFIMILITVITCFGYYYKIPIFIQINRLLSNRLYYSVKGISEWGVSLFGKKLTMYGWGGYGYMQTPVGFHYNYIDNEFIQILLSYGVLYTIILFVFYSRTIRKSIEDGNNELLVILILYLILAFIEPNLMKFSRDIFILCMASEMFRGGIFYLKMEDNKMVIRVKNSDKELL